MGQVRHGSATTTHAVRAAIQRSQASLATLKLRDVITASRSCTLTVLHARHVTRSDASIFRRSHSVFGSPTTSEGYANAGNGNCSPRTASAARA